MAGTISPIDGRRTTEPASHRGDLSAEDFWQLLLKHLQMQDPFQTTDMSTMLEQFVTVQAAREMAQVSNALQRLQALLLVGRQVLAHWDGETVQGTVVSVSLSGSPTLTVQMGEKAVAIPLKAVWEVATERHPLLSPQPKGKEEGDGQWA